MPNLDQIDRLLVDALPWLSVVVFAPLLILAVVFGTEAHRLGDENVHDVSDFAPQPVPAGRTVRRRLRPAPEPTPIHDEVAGLPMSDDTARAVARVWLRDIAAVQQAKAGIRPAYATADRDLTGAFPVVRAA